MRSITVHFSAREDLAKPTPMIAVDMLWVVDTGIPKCAAIVRMVAELVSAAKPLIGRSGVHATLVAPTPDEEVHRDEHDLPEDEEQEEVEGEEYADTSGLEDEHPAHERLQVVLDGARRPRSART